MERNDKLIPRGAGTFVDECAGLTARHRVAVMAKIPKELSDEQVVLLADIASTGISGAESAKIKIGDTVVVFAQGPIGLCATAGAKLMGAALVIGVDGDSNRLRMCRGAHASVAYGLRSPLTLD